MPFVLKLFKRHFFFISIYVYYLFSDRPHKKDNLRRYTSQCLFKSAESVKVICCHYRLSTLCLVIKVLIETDTEI